MQCLLNRSEQLDSHEFCEQFFSQVSRKASYHHVLHSHVFVCYRLIESVQRGKSGGEEELQE